MCYARSVAYALATGDFASGQADIRAVPELLWRQLGDGSKVLGAGPAAARLQLLHFPLVYARRTAVTGRRMSIVKSKFVAWLIVCRSPFKWSECVCRALSGQHTVGADAQAIVLLLA